MIRSVSAPHRHERWVCGRCDNWGTNQATAREHRDHPAGWRREGNQHPEIDRFDPKHPDKVKGFFWTVDLLALALEAARRYPEGSERRGYWLERAGEIAAASGQPVETWVLRWKGGPKRESDLIAIAERALDRRAAEMTASGEPPEPSRKSVAGPQRQLPADSGGGDAPLNGAGKEQGPNRNAVPIEP